MPSFADDFTRFQAFEHRAGVPLGEENIPLSVIEWAYGQPHGEHYRVGKASALSARGDDWNLRVIFAPLDLPNRDVTRGLLKLMEYFSIPSGFVSERLQSVSHSFGTRNDDGAQCSWFHYLCKNITLQHTESGHAEIVNPNIRTGAEPQSQADFSWHRAGFFLHAAPGRPPHSRSDSGHPDSKGTGKIQQTTKVTLICFGAPPALEQRFYRLALHHSWVDALADPYTLFDIVLDELYLQMDSIAWSLSEVFGGIEGRTFNRAVEPGKAADRIDFVGLHNVSKHVIYLREAAEAILLTLESMRAHHRHSMDSNLAAVSATQSSLRYRKTMFCSTQLRLQSLEKRMGNLIQLSFNLVTQQDSRILQVDSRVMKMIAVMTLFFLPASTVAAIFSSQFFTLTGGSDDSGQGGNKMSVSPFFWLFWVVVVPLTIIVVSAGTWYYRKAQKELIHGKQPLRRTATWMSGKNE